MQEEVDESRETKFKEEFIIIEPPTLTENLCTEPIRSVDAFLAFDSSKVNRRLKSLSPWERKDYPGPLMLLCHDMSGGYKDDRFVDGTDNPNYFNFYNWAQIDIFVYFSHCFITIPPVMWMDSSHRNGIPILGTFITEWAEGSVKCSQVFGSPQTAVLTAQLLVDIATCYCFDGWLINIENKLQLNEVENVHVFLRELTKLMKFVNSNSYVIWYDSVTINGKLKWQDSLTDLNIDYFNCCDGIFLNYTWKDWQLNLTSQLCEGREHDVFVGIDVWSRNCVGGFETHQSCEMIKDFGLSIALFAPGWVYETADSDVQFEMKNSMYWELLWRICPPRPLKVRDLNCYFSTGAGSKEFYKGALVGEKSWFNMMKQNLPFVRTGYVKADLDELAQSVLVKFTKKSAYKGSTCVRIVTNLRLVEIQKLFGVNVDVKKCVICLAVCLDQSRTVETQADQAEVVKVHTDQAEVVRVHTDQAEVVRVHTDQAEVVKVQTDQSEINLSLIVTNDNKDIDILQPFETCNLPNNNWIKFYFKYQATSLIKWVGVNVIKPDGFDVLVGKLRIKEVDQSAGVVLKNCPLSDKQ